MSVPTVGTLFRPETGVQYRYTTLVDLFQMTHTATSINYNQRILMGIYKIQTGFHIFYIIFIYARAQS